MREGGDLREGGHREGEPFAQGRAAQGLRAAEPRPGQPRRPNRPSGQYRAGRCHGPQRGCAGPCVRVFSGRVRAGRRQAGRPVLHPAQHRGAAGGHAGALQGPRVRSLLRLGRHVRAVREVYRRASGARQRHLDLRAGKQPDHLAAGQDEPGHPRHRQLAGEVEQRGLVPQRRAQGSEGRLHHRQSAVQRQRLERRPLAQGWALAVRRVTCGQRQLRVATTLYLPPRAHRQGRRGVGQGGSHQQVQRRRGYPQGADQGGQPDRLYRQPARQALPEHPDSGGIVVHSPRPRRTLTPALSQRERWRSHLRSLQ